MTEKMNLTAYAAAQIVNNVLAERNILDAKTGSVKKIPTQMMYNYIKTNIIGSYVEDGKKYVDVESFSRWLKNYINKQEKKNGSTDYVKTFMDQM